MNRGTDSMSGPANPGIGEFAQVGNSQSTLLHGYRLTMLTAQRAIRGCLCPPTDCTSQSFFTDSPAVCPTMRRSSVPSLVSLCHETRRNGLHLKHGSELSSGENPRFRLHDLSEKPRTGSGSRSRDAVPPRGLLRTKGGRGPAPALRGSRVNRVPISRSCVSQRGSIPV